MNELVLGIGGNKENRLFWLKKTADEIGRLIGNIEQFSPVVESEPWGFVSETWFLNQVLLVKTRFKAGEVIRLIHKIETESGRVREGVYTDRNIDIDILFFGNDIIREENLIIPHPKLHERLFVLAPMARFMPDFLHPVLRKNISELLAKCKDSTTYHWYSPD
ncbi:MAG: 2-amino-4-hydroxy-6-hydroxymethyldihydropteridine diphosphokinase [Bacteroidetes bacterium]|nr:2-amino-4-hydroxy-6-hydroxymethyldihydropteridine diphosphokinase [Bacteroidota bacterium]